MKLRRSVIIATLAFMVMPVGVHCRADDALGQGVKSGSIARQGAQTSVERKFPIAVPPASELLTKTRGMKEHLQPVQERETEESPQVRMYRQFVEQGAYVVPAGPQGLPGLRQLPEGSLQRPVETAGRNYQQPSVTSPGSRVEWGINLKTHRFERYYGLSRFGNTTFGLSLGRGKRAWGRYYRTGPN